MPPWPSLAENEWPILGENTWTSLGENDWPILGENLWTIIVRKMTRGPGTPASPDPVAGRCPDRRRARYDVSEVQRLGDS